MSRTNCQILFQVKALHSYFKQNRCTCLDYKATDSTLNAMRQFGMKIRPLINGFGFYVNTNDSIDRYLKYIETTSGKSSFDFDITTNTSNFNIITDIPVNWVGCILFDSGNISNGVKGNILEIKGDYTKPDNPISLARLKINFKDIVKYKLENSDPEFEMVFNARSTQWNYYVINRNSLEIDKPKITGKSEIQFNGPFNKTIQTGEVALLFTSGNHLIPLSEIPKYKFNLINESKVSGETTKNRFTPKIIYEGLPNPDPGKIGIEEEAGKNLVSSSMYVYV